MKTNKFKILSNAELQDTNGGVLPLLLAWGAKMTVGKAITIGVAVGVTMFVVDGCTSTTQCDE